MPDIFISYKREDRSYARVIAENLVKRGHDVWWDVELLPGDKFADEINNILEKAKAVIVLWTPNSVESGWVKSEALIAFNKNILVPIKLRDTEIPIPFNSIQTLDLTSWEEGHDEVLLILTQAVERKLGVVNREEKTLSKQDVDNVLQRPQHEVEFWESISKAPNQSIKEYSIYINKYGENGVFYDLALQRINTSEGRRGKPRMIENITIISVLMGIIVGGFTIANYLGVFNPEKSVSTTKIPDAIPSNEIEEPPKAVEKEFFISSVGGWSSTGVIINKNDILEITYKTGCWTGNRNQPSTDPCHGPEGPPKDVHLGDGNYPAPGIIENSLVGKIGGDKFLVGGHLKKSATKAGELMLAMNDWGYHDNNGQIGVLIRVSKPVKGANKAN